MLKSLLFLFTLLFFFQGCATSPTQSSTSPSETRFIQLASQIPSPCDSTRELKLLDNLDNADKQCKNSVILSTSLLFFSESPLKDEEVLEIIQLESQQLLSPVSIDTFDRPRLGNPDAPIEIVVFSDFQCPYCRVAAKTLEKVAHTNPDTVTLVFKHFPLSFHQLAAPAALVAEAGYSANKFWEVHDYIFDHQAELNGNFLHSTITKFGFDIENTFYSSMGEAFFMQIAKDFEDGRSINVSGTPTVYINGVLVEAPTSLIRMQMRIDAEIAYENERLSKELPETSPYVTFLSDYESMTNLQRSRLLSISNSVRCPCESVAENLHQCASAQTCESASALIAKIIQGIRDNHSTMQILMDLK